MAKNEPALCALCNEPVETHRYMRAEPGFYKRIGKHVTFEPLERRTAKSFYHLTHALEEIEQDVVERWKPTKDTPVRMLWSPAPSYQRGPRDEVGVSFGSEPLGGVVRIKRSRDGQHGVRTVIAGDQGALHMSLPELLPPGTTWLVPRPGELVTAGAGTTPGWEV